jgi:DNA (cytosine-5)-methyltransferase 1
MNEFAAFRMLDAFCGMGGVSDGFALEGFDVTGIDIVDAPKMLGYKHRFIQADMLTLKGEDFRGYDVVWGSPPCRDFSQIGLLYGKRWKNPPNPENGLKIVRHFLEFAKEAKPTFWVMENVANLKKHLLELQPRTEGFITYGKRHVFYGNYPLFLMPRDMRIKIRCQNKNGRDQPNMKYLEPTPCHNRAIQSGQHAKIPLVCSRAFAKACKEALMEKVEAI